MDNQLIFTVSELNRHIRESIEPIYPDIWIEGEISNFRLPSSGHSYFTLKDKQSQLRTVMFKFRNRSLKFKPEDGLKVICRGRISVYEPRGEYQLVAEIMEPRGIGELQLAFEQLKKKLAAEGLFDPVRKKPLPFLPKRIVVITSPTGAAVRDIIQIATRRYPNLEILVLPVKVQGDEAPDEIVAALAAADRLRLGEVIILGRGGGSLEDLWAFNAEKVARAIAACTIPIVSAVGHEIDITIADFTADLRAPTPSAAAELVVKEKAELTGQVNQTTARLQLTFTQAIARRRDAVISSNQRLRSPLKKITDHQQHIDELNERMGRILPAALRFKQAAHKSALGMLRSNAPDRTIRRRRADVNYLKQQLSGRLQSLTGTKKMALQRLAGQLHALSPLQV
ncbi:MAG: exodeoxyribonuclease VII large subunit, partial [Deltaproteobacteria bacterium]|nr:exodeoxyribonuclease VII large subunit [Deltaproteobacteria bacterium]